MLDREIEWLRQEKYNGVETANFFLDVERLKNGEPLAYVIGSIPFLNTVINLDSRPLIPRAETEFLVEKVIKDISNTTLSTESINILDLCSGSGCIGVAILKALPYAKVDFIEVDEKHLETIKNNCLNNNLDLKQCRIFQGNLFDINSDVNLYQYDYIISNPPYIDPKLDRADNSVKEFEPHLALYGGKGGMEIIEKIVIESPKHLNSKGQLWIEHEPEQALIIKLLANNKFSTTTYKDQYQKERFTKLVLQ